MYDHSYTSAERCHAQRRRCSPCKRMPLFPLSVPGTSVRRCLAASLMSITRFDTLTLPSLCADASRVILLHLCVFERYDSGSERLWIFLCLKLSSTSCDSACAGLWWQKCFGLAPMMCCCD